MSLAALSAALLALSGSAWSQTPPWPSKPIRIVVAYGPGGQTDIVARVIGERLQQRLGQPVLVENRAGGGGNVGTDHVAKSAPDGYTLAMAAISNFGANPALYPKIPYDPLKDFVPVAHAISTSNVLVVHPSFPARTLPELIALAKAKPGALSYASAGAGTSIHLFMEVLKLRAGLDITHIPYRGSAPALQDVVGGQVPMIFDSMPSAFPMVKAGKLRALAVSSGTRSPVAPDVPTVAEQGVANFDLVSWIGFAAPAGTPDPIVQRLNGEINAILRMPEVVARFNELGAQTVGGSTASFDAFIRQEIATWTDVVKKAGITAD
ncbi:MAG: tripartite tricarboxylate transporter substrate binding protein [Rhizobacter sp.]|nr:tripartite tricarboxylate transporter substrate binding protein [Rhizobacter sp.]